MTLALDDFPRLPPEYVRRERLNDSLSAMKNDQLIVIEGPPGIGKTSLVADWASQDLGSFECTWLTLDSSVTSAQLLWNAIHEELCPGLLSPPVGYAGLAAWINKQDKPLRIVIDDFYWAPLQVVLEVLKFAHMLTNGQVIVLTRRDASGILKPQAQRMSSGWITADDLYLDLNEVRLLKSELYPGSAEFTKAEFEQLQTLSEGHPLLTRLALKEEGLASAEEIAEQSGGWIVGQLESRNFTNTLHVSLLPLFNLELLESLFGRAQARSLIADLERTGIGHAAPAGFMKLCGPAGAAVHHQALLILSQAEQDETLRIATDYFKDLKGYAAQTVHLLCTTGRYEELWPYFASNFEDVFHPEIVKEINSLPPRVREKSPMVATLALLIQASRERHPSINLLAEVDSILALLETRVYEADIEVRLYDQVARLALAWSARRFEEAEEPTEEILKLLSELAVQEGAEVREAAYWGLLYASVMMALCGRFDLAERYLYSMESDQDPARSARRTLQHAFINAMRGEVLTSQQILADNIFHVENSAHWSLVFAITQAAIWLEDGNAFAAQKILKEAEALLNKATNWPYALIVLARTHLFTSPEAGTEDLRRLTRMHGDRYIAAGLQDLLHSAVIDLSVAAGDLPGARDQLGSATSGSPAVGH